MIKLLKTTCAVALSLFALGAFAQEIKGDAAAGQTKNAMCIGCHGIKGYQASFPEVHKVPMISGQSAKYIVSALNAYKQGDRKHPAMRGIAQSLSDQDMADLAAYYSTHGLVGASSATRKFKEPSVQVQALMNKAACQSCHGADLNTPTEGTPKLAGQYPDYLFVALKAYKHEPNNVVGRSNPIMGGMVKQFSNAELKLLANYIGSLDGQLQVVPQAKFR